MAEQTSISLNEPAYCLQVEEVARLLETDLERGLSKQEAKRRHEISGDNVLAGVGGVSIWKVLVRQVANALTLVQPSLTLASANNKVLIMAMALSYGTTDFIEGGVITAVIVRTSSRHKCPNISQYIHRFHHGIQS
jgi:P-type Na+/K+ transporter